MALLSPSLLPILSVCLSSPTIVTYCIPYRQIRIRDLASRIARVRCLCHSVHLLPTQLESTLQWSHQNAYVAVSLANADICGHRTVKAPHPVRSAKLSTVSPSQYCGGGPRGKLGCCSSFFRCLLFAFLFL